MEYFSSIIVIITFILVILNFEGFCSILFVMIQSASQLGPYEDKAFQHYFWPERSDNPLYNSKPERYKDSNRFQLDVMILATGKFHKIKKNGLLWDSLKDRGDDIIITKNNKNNVTIKLTEKAKEGIYQIYIENYLNDKYS